MMDDNYYAKRAERKARLRDVFVDTLDQLNKNKRLIKETELAMKEAVFYDANERVQFQPEKHDTKITVTNERSFEAAERLLREGGGRVAVLNFANSFTPGGGVYGGSGAQEESLCRCSNLYPIIEQERFYEAYYDKNRSGGDFRGSDAVIYAKDVTVFKSDTDYPELLSEQDWYKVDVITCAAPNLAGKSSFVDRETGYAYRLDSDWQTRVHWHRADHILRAALANGARKIVLGAFGCGAFKNDPKSAARGIARAIHYLPDQFEEIVFAIYHRPHELHNFQAFQRVFLGHADYDMTRFLEAHAEHYERALSEIKAGRKQSHWMWYIFPQLRGLGFSQMSEYYGLDGVDEAKAFLKEPVLKKHLVEISEALYRLDGDIEDILGGIDSLKLNSSMTLFNAADPSIEVFEKIIDKFYGGKKDQRTLSLMD